MSDLAKYAVPNIRDGHHELLHLEMMTPAGPRRRCHPHLANGGDFAFGVSDVLIKLTDPQLRGPAAHWEGICRECRATLGLADLLRALHARLEAPECRHGVSLRESCPLCENALRSFNELGPTDVPIEGWQVLPFGQPALLMPDQTLTLQANPQKIMRGPYRLGFHVVGNENNRDVYLQEVKIGNTMLPIAWGEIWGWAFEDIADNKNAYERLLPLAGPCINLGQCVTATVHNRSAVAVRVSLVLFGHGFREEEERAPIRMGATGDPRISAGPSRQLGAADPRRPPQLPGHLSVRRPDRVPVPTGLDAEFYAVCDDLLGPNDAADFSEEQGDDLFALVTPNVRRSLMAAAAKQYNSPMVKKPMDARLHGNPIEVLLDLGEELHILQLKRGTAVTYQGTGSEWCDLLAAWQAVKSLRKQFELHAAPEEFVPPRFEVCGVQFEVRRYEPPPPAPPPELSEGERKYNEARALDEAATHVHAIHEETKRARYEEDETAWESPHDEWP